MRIFARGQRALLAAVGLAVLGVPLTPAPTAVADTPGCVSRAEYRAVKDGWTRARVARVFDIKGRSVTVNDTYHARTYNDCWRSDPTVGNVSVFYKHRNGAWRVVDKTTEFWHP